jgi:hypothetical protein
MSAARRSLSLAATSVHIRIRPQPANLSESREILRVLQQRFGEITTFRHLRYEYHNPAANSAIAIFRDAESAQQALNASPVRFALEKVQPEEEDQHITPETKAEESTESAIEPPAPFTLTSDIESLTRPPRLLNPLIPEPPTQRINATGAPKTPDLSTSQIPFYKSTQPKSTAAVWFDLTIDRSRTVHQDYVERQPFWTKFHPMKSMAQEDLAKVVPHVGLSDVTKRANPRTPTFLLEQRASNVKQTKSLRQLYEEGLGES